MTTKFDEQRHQHNLAEFDDKLIGLQAEIARIEEARREYINRHNLNDKPVKP